ncbi:unnamed protein product [Arctia plantaginis]|uniref:Uncharacterized protein n=1 Tax=Arctia plantaginis TaxID=874455 RepID=A0A8S1BLC6_ARCPL|nr:unnamed protein product [Arctia plantaginis]
MASGGSVPRSIKPCVSAPACSTHKCRHKPDPCPDPEKCFQKSKKKTVRCPSAMAVVTPRGLDCSCTPEFSKYNRSRKPGEKKRSKTPYRKRVAKMYRKRSTINKFPRQKRCAIL